MLTLRLVVTCPACSALVDYNRPYFGGDLAARSVLCECGFFVGACTVEEGEVTFKVGPAPVPERTPFLLDPKYNEQLENAPSGFRNFLRGAAERYAEPLTRVVDAASLNMGALCDLARNPVTLADTFMEYPATPTRGPRPKRSRIVNGPW